MNYRLKGATPEKIQKLLAILKANGIELVQVAEDLKATADDASDAEAAEIYRLYGMWPTKAGAR